MSESAQAQAPILPAHILVVDDDDDMRRELVRIFEKRGYRASASKSGDEAFERIKATEIDLVVTDLNMGGMTGVELCDRIVQNWRDLPVIVVTGFGSMETAVATLRAGAFDFITKPFHAENLAVSAARALKHRALTREVKRLEHAVGSHRSDLTLLGQSDAMQTMRALISQVSQTDVTALITGESGSGKELVAHAIHAHSSRSSAAFVAINCAAMPEPLLESELFGHVRGAFTDAKTQKRGLLQEAEGGTLFLDEVGEMPLSMQAKLLRALEVRKARPVGGEREIAFDTRIVAATNRNLEAMIAEKTFREDLFYRINVVHIEVPPLRERGADILLLSHAFLERLAPRLKKNVRGISASVASKLLHYAWPGNVRELANTIERALALSHFDELTVEDLPQRIRDYSAGSPITPAQSASELVSMDVIEARYIRQVMELVGYRKTEAARILGFDRSTLYRKLERYKIESSDG
jgi:two-component system, NtrC family, response regulator AtoC